MKWFQSKSLRQQVLTIKYFSHTVLVFIADFEYVFTKLDLIAVGNQQTFTRSKSTIETLAQGIFKVNNKDTRTSPKTKRLAKIVNGKPLAILAKRSILEDVVLVSLLITLKIFYNFFIVSIVDFEQVKFYWKGRA